MINPVHRKEKKKELINYKYHHFGISTNFKKRNMFYLKDYKVHYTDHQANPFGIQWMKYDSNCKLPSIVQKISHVAFQVNNLKQAIKGRKVIIEPNSRSKGILTAFIEENGAPIEFLQID